MMIRSGHWHDSAGRIREGKLHWMTEPWVTKCGRKIGEDWRFPEYSGYRVPVFRPRGMHDQCKQCFGVVEE